MAGAGNSSFQKYFEQIRGQISHGLSRFDASTEIDAHLREKLNELKQVVNEVEENQKIVTEGCSNYDFVDSNGIRVEGNGYRSLLYILNQFLPHFTDCLEDCVKWRLLTSKNKQLDDLKSAIRALNSLNIVFKNTVLMMRNHPTSLLEPNYRNMLETGLTEDMGRDVFFDKFLGFQYPKGEKLFLSVLAVVFALYDTAYSNDMEGFLKKVILRFLKPTHLDDEEKGIMIANLADCSSIHLAKTFFELPQKKEFRSIMKLVNELVLPTDVYTAMTIPSEEIKAKTLGGDTVTLRPPTASIGPHPIRFLLVSKTWREGQERPSELKEEVKPAPPSDNLVVHIHGGGFVATSADSQEPLLRTWTHKFDCPIVSIDYSLAPEAPYSRALEECVFAFVWVLNNLEALGTTAKKIILTGDSAGGNFVLTTALKLKEHNFRLPDHIVAFYPVTIVKLVATPARLLSLYDVLLPIGILIPCLQAYLGVVASDETVKKRREIRKKIFEAKDCQAQKKNDTSSSADSCPNVDQLTKELIDTYEDSPLGNEPFVSPSLADNETLKGLPPVSVVSSGLDPLLDDGVEFAQRLKAIGQPVTFQVLEGLPHGYLNYFFASPTFRKAEEKATDVVKKALDM